MANINRHHPAYNAAIEDWTKYRDCYRGGDTFVNSYLTRRPGETEDSFLNRVSLSYPTTYAKSAINKIINTLIQRMGGVTRVEGTSSYTEACFDNRGLDRYQNTILTFANNILLPELLPMGKVGVYVDAPRRLNTQTKADDKGFRPYVYTYRAEDIWSWSESANGELLAVLLAEQTYKYDKLGLPTQEVERYRYLRKTAEGIVVVVYNEAWKQQSTEVLKLSRLPIIISSLREPMMKDIASLQITLLNLVSGGLLYTSESTITVYTEQKGSVASNGVSQRAEYDAINDEVKDTKTQKSTVNVRQSKGRRYPYGADRPGFISPPTGPIEACLKQQERLEADIDKILNMKLVTLSSSSADSKREERRAAEDGLAAIGAEMERVENFIATMWAEYESTTAAVIKYPRDYAVKSDKERIEDANALIDLADRLNSELFRTQMAQKAAEMALSATTDRQTVEEVIKQLKDQVTPIVPSDLLKHMELGMVSAEDGCDMTGYPKGSHVAAQNEKIRRTAEVIRAQNTLKVADGGDPIDMKPQEV